MTIAERVDLYKKLFPDCRAIDPVKEIVAKGFEKAPPLQRLELIRELDTMLAEKYSVFIPVVTVWVRDNSYVHQCREIYLTEPELEAFLHQFRHHLQRIAREQERITLLVEEKAEIDKKIPYKDTIYRLEGEDDARAWAKMIMESI